MHQVNDIYIFRYKSYYLLIKLRKYICINNHYKYKSEKIQKLSMNTLLAVITSFLCSYKETVMPFLAPSYHSILTPYSA